MSGALLAVQAAASAVTAVQLLIGSGRKIGPYMATATVREYHQDELEITENPIEFGAEITDHVFKRPSRVSIRAGWDGSAQALLGQALSGASLSSLGSSALSSLTGTYPAQIYEQLLALQVSGQTFTVVTGKRIYKNCLMATLSEVTDQTTEKVLFVDMEIKEAIIVQTTQTTIAPASAQANPANTAPVVNNGSQQPSTPQNSSLLFQMFNGSSGVP
jgi:hypothetical protein